MAHKAESSNNIKVIQSAVTVGGFTEYTVFRISNGLRSKVCKHAGLMKNVAKFSSRRLECFEWSGWL